jgi:hypothetical protein
MLSTFFLLAIFIGPIKKGCAGKKKGYYLKPVRHGLLRLSFDEHILKTQTRA